MNIKVMPHYFLVRIEKEKQKQYKEQLTKDSILVENQVGIFQTKNMEHGEIVQIGSKMLSIAGFSEIRPGDTLIFHWSIEAPQDKVTKRFYLYEDEKFNYYVVDEINVRGYYNGHSIIPHPNFIFLKDKQIDSSEGQYDKELEAKLKITNGIISFCNWEDSKTSLQQRSKQIEAQINSLAKNTRTAEIQNVMNKLDAERKAIGRKLNKKEYAPYLIAYSNPRLDRDFGTSLKEDDILYCFNAACNYKTNFQLFDYKFIICPIEYIGLLDRRKTA